MEFITKTVERQQVRAMPNAPAAARAVMYLSGLDQWDFQAREGNFPESQVMFFRRLRLELEATLERFERSAAGWNESVNDFESYIELDWLCNQCEYWMGPADRVELSRINQKFAEMDCRAVAMTSWEFMAVRTLARVTSLLVRAKRNPLVLWPRPLRICRWAIRKSKEVFTAKMFDLRHARRRFKIWLKMVLLRFD